MTWDPKEKAYKNYVFGNDFPGCIVETGQFEGDTLVFCGEFSTGAMKIAVRSTTKVIAPRKTHQRRIFFRQRRTRNSVRYGRRHQKM